MSVKPVETVPDMIASASLVPYDDDADGIELPDEADILEDNDTNPDISDKESCRFSYYGCWFVGEFGNSNHVCSRCRYSYAFHCCAHQTVFNRRRKGIKKVN